MSRRELYNMEGKFTSNYLLLSSIVRTQTMAKIPTTINGIQIAKNQFLVGPYRVLPGRLSVFKDLN